MKLKVSCGLEPSLMAFGTCFLHISVSLFPPPLLPVTLPPSLLLSPGTTHCCSLGTQKVHSCLGSPEICSHSTGTSFSPEMLRAILSSHVSINSDITSHPRKKPAFSICFGTMCCSVLHPMLFTTCSCPINFLIYKVSISLSSTKTFWS